MLSSWLPLLAVAMVTLIPLVTSSFINDNVNVTLHVMTICPDAALCEPIFADVLSQVGSIVNFKTDYVATLESSGSITCKHGDPECEGNMQQLCARNLYPNVDQWFQFVLCQSERYNLIPANANSCSRELGLSYSDITNCVASQGHDLHANSIRITQSRGVTKSCTIVIEDEIICVRDGSWYNCPGGYDVADFVRQICEAYTGSNPPPACTSGKFFHQG